MNYTIEQQTIMTRVRKGKIWLIKNEGSLVYAKHLKIYEDLVDELKTHKIKEFEAWGFEPQTVDQMLPEEVEETIKKGYNESS